MDKNAVALLRIINEECKEKEYKIFTLDDFKESVPFIEENKIEDTVFELAAEGYIMIKYSGDGFYCIRNLPLGRLYNKREKEEKLEYRERLTLIIIAVFSGGFLGGFIGAMIFSLIMNLIR